MTQTVPLFRASAKMMLRSRGVIFALVATPIQVAALGLMQDLAFDIDGQSISFFDYALPGMATLLADISLADIMVAVASSYRSRGILKGSPSPPSHRGVSVER